MRVIGLGALAVLLLSTPAFAVVEYLGTITADATTAKNQTSTAATFTIEPGHDVAIQCDAAAYLRWFSSTTGVAAATTGIKLAADALYVTTSGKRLQYLSVLSAAGTANCRVFRSMP